MGTQSDYRESDTQTDPWTAPYTLRPGSAPEVLTLQSLSYGEHHDRLHIHDCLDLAALALPRWPAA